MHTPVTATVAQTAKAKPGRPVPDRIPVPGFLSRARPASKATAVPLCPASAVITTAPPRFQPTAEQEAILATTSALGPDSVLGVVAFAGAGKTSTLKMIAAALRGSGIYTAFNRDIVLAGQAAFPPSVRCKTAHSIAYAAMGIRRDETENLNGHSVLKLLGEAPGCWLSQGAAGVKPIGQARLVAKAVTEFCQSADIALTDAHVEQVLTKFFYRVPNETPTDTNARKAHDDMMMRRNRLAPAILVNAREAWKRLSAWRQHGVKVAHDVYLKAFELDTDLVARTFAGFDFVLFDEAQDVNGVMRSIVAKCGRRVIAVGDPWQAIYSWRGAEDALGRLPGERLYLSQSFRFGEAVAAVARTVLAAKPTVRPPVPLRGNPGRDSRIVLDRDLDAPPSAIVCRSNAGVFKEAVAAAKAGQRVNLGDKFLAELSEELTSALALYEKRSGDVKTESLRRFASWDELKDEAEQMQDGSLQRLIDAVEDGTLVRDLRVLEQQHEINEDRADVVIRTTHRAKGREWSSVRLAGDFSTLEKMTARYWAAVAKGDAAFEAQTLEDFHVLYVAVTRAIDVLALPGDLHRSLMGADHATKETTNAHHNR